MQLYIADRISRAEGGPKQFFRSAYIWRFGKDANVEHDVLTYQVGGIVPEYVREYVCNMQQKEKGHALQEVSRAN